jgi:HD superfamily phosphohydrolase
MPSRSIQRVQDAIHGLMEFRGLEAAVIELLETQELQRLRRIRQLGLGNLVFPAAEHSRLVHGIGAAHLAIRFVRRLEDATRETLDPAFRPDQEVRRDIAIAALVHDVGHGPLSHAWEEVMADFSRDEWAKSLKLEQTPPAEVQWHEMVGLALLRREGGSLHQALETQESGTANRIAGLLEGEYYLSYLPRLLDGDVDVDRCDYLIRDAQMTGVAYGRYDINWLISTAGVGVNEQGELVVGFDYHKAPRVVEQLLVARRALYDTVYQHKTVRAAEGMVVLFLQRMRTLVAEGAWPFPDDEPFAGFKKVFEQVPLSCEELLDLDDFALWRLVMRSASQVDDPTASDLARKILNRELLKLVPVTEAHLSGFLHAADWKARVAAVVSHYVPGDPAFYVYSDRQEHSVWSGDPGRQAYLIKSNTGGLGRAQRAQDHPDLSSLGSGWNHETRRLFVPQEAVPAVHDLITP